MQPWTAWTDADDRYLLAHYSTQTMGGMAAALGRTSDAVQWRCDQLVRAGRLDRASRCYHRPWTEDEDDYLSDHWGRLPDATVARALNRTAVACKIRALRGLGISARDGNLWTARAVGRLFGVNSKTVMAWVGRGWLECRRSPVSCGRSYKWDVAEDSIERFIRERGWAFDWKRMELGTYYRNLAERIDRADPWLTMVEAAAVIGWRRGRLRLWLRRGFLRYERRLKQQQAGAPMIVVRRADLAGFVERVTAAVHENRSRASRKRTLREGGWGRRRRTDQQERVA